MKLKAYIDGQYVDAPNRLAIISPWNNQVAGTVPALDQKHIDQAFNAAAVAFPLWRDLALPKRQALLEKFGQLLLLEKKQLATLMHAEIAKPLNEGEHEVDRTFTYLQDTITEWKAVGSERLVAGDYIDNISRLPLGVVLAISPFNYPINLSLAKIIPALLVGNTVVFKPATNGSLVGAFLATLFDRAGFPKGTVNVVTGRGKDIGDLLTTHEHIAMISFTGGVTVGKRIAKLQAMVPLVLELGGNDGAYVRSDADLPFAAKEVARGAFAFAGQRCTAIKRLVVASTIKDKFIPLLIKEVAKITVNPLVTTAAADYVDELITDSRKRGDHFIIEGPRTGNTIAHHIVETTFASRAWREEAFGPLLPIIYLKNEAKLVELLNDTEYGLQNSLFTTDVVWARQIALSLECGTVNINRSSSRSPDIFPFLGTKDSGFGAQGIREALLSMTRILNVVEKSA